MPTLELLVTIIAGIGNFFLGIFTFSKDTRSATNRLFALFTTTLSLYLFFNYFSLHQTNVLLTQLWVRTVMSVAVFINLSFFLLAITYPGKKLAAKSLNLWVLIILTVLIALLAQTKLIFTDVNIVDGNIQPSSGVGMPLFLLHTVGLLGGGLAVLIRKYLKAEGMVKRQLRILFWGAVIMFTFIFITNVFLVLVFNISTFVNLLPIYTLILTGFISYAILQHSLFNLKVLATQVFTVVIWIILFSKVIVNQNLTEIVIDLTIFGSMVVFGIFLMKSVVREVKHREQLQELTNKLKALDKQKDEFISMAAHELRAPMTAIKGYVSMVLEGDTGDIPEKARGFLADANNINDRLIRLVNNMLNVSRIEEGRMVYQMEEENLSNAVRAVFSTFVPEAERKGLEYKLEIPNHIKDKVKVDPDRVQEVIGNFISNAVKYTDSGFVKVRLNQPNKGFVRCEVVDTGPGISKEEQKKLFRKFHRVESNVGKTTGTGLGLYICKLLVERFNGKIGLESELGKGSNFWFELPLVG